MNKFKKSIAVFCSFLFLIFSQSVNSESLIGGAIKLVTKVAAEEAVRKTFFDDDKKSKTQPNQQPSQNSTRSYSTPVTPKVIQKIVIGSQELNVRSGPSAEYEIVGKVYLGNVLNTYEEVYGWTRIGQNQWVKSNYLENTQLTNTSKEPMNQHTESTADLTLVSNVAGAGMKIYIEPFLSKSLGNGVVRVMVLTSFDEITSAMMFGLSVEQRMDLNCEAQLVRELDTKWYEKRMAKGKVIEQFSASNLPEWVPFYTTTESTICNFLKQNKISLMGY